LHVKISSSTIMQFINTNLAFYSLFKLKIHVFEFKELKIYLIS
jgi:hypothetical protein